MKKFILSLAVAATLLVGSLATPNTAEAQRWRGGYYGGYYRPYYGSYYRPYYGSYYQPYTSYYRSYYGGYYPGSYGYGYAPQYYYGSPGYYSPGVRIGAAPIGVRIY